MTDDISKTVVGVLLLLTIIVSVIGTIVVLNSLDQIKVVKGDEPTTASISTEQARIMGEQLATGQVIKEKEDMYNDK
ncbi:hypothetical protein KY339_02140 [Candidatus Woesearchaeota archaeon]|nr:hypothetical protein [Candidatus Woesearchaeota archaeon]